MATVAQCLWVKQNPIDFYPFVAGQICNLTRHNSIIFTHGEGRHPGYPGIPIFAPYSRDRFRLLRASDHFAESLFRSPWVFSLAMRKHQVKILHAHMGHQGILFLPLKKKYKVPLITSFHGSDASDFPRSPENLSALRKLFEEGDLFTVVSEQMKCALVSLGCPTKKIVVHHVGVDLAKFQPQRPDLTTDRFTILTIGNYQEKKGFAYLVRALKRVRHQFSKVELRIVGEALTAEAQKPEIEALIDELDLRDNIVLTGFVPQARLSQEFEKADIFVLPSVTAQNGDKEGVPTVLMEAQASGLPVVSTYHSGIPEVINDGESGYLVPEKDVDQLAEKICLLFNNRQTWVEMGRLGRQHVERNFNLDVQIKKLEEIYDRLC